MGIQVDLHSPFIFFGFKFLGCRPYLLAGSRVANESSRVRSGRIELVRDMFVLKSNPYRTFF